MPGLETGLIQCGGDWPGVFIRGDNAAAYARVITMALEEFRTISPIHAAMLRGLCDLLRSSDTRHPTFATTSVQQVQMPE